MRIRNQFGRIVDVHPSMEEYVLLQTGIEILDVDQEKAEQIKEAQTLPEVIQRRKVTMDWTKEEILEYLGEIGVKVENAEKMTKKELVALIS
jgi:hypothetical protein